MNTVDAPRAVLDVTRATTFLTALTELAAGTITAMPEGYSTPAAYDIHMSERWTPDLTDEDFTHDNDENQTAAAIIRSVHELGILRLPAGTVASLVDGPNGYYYWSLTNERWAGMTLISTMQTWINWDTMGKGIAGVRRALILLHDFVDAANEMLTAVFLSASTVLAEFSTDPVLLTRLADYDEAIVRTTAIDNPAAPDEAKVLAALRTNAAGN
jgi:hypothetical protein